MTGRPAATRGLALAFGVGAFVLLCTINSAGYRYGASDQAFYVPAVLADLEPTLFPRDRALIESQARLTIVDEALAALVGLSGLELPALAALLYVVSLTVLATSGWLLSQTLYRSAWTGVALLAALTLRHAIARSGTNSLEPYFHPRQLAFGLGALAVVAFLRGRVALPVALVAIAGIIHPTTALWFAIWIGAALVVAERRLRVPAAVAVAGAIVVAAWALTIGPLAGRLVVMDPAWLGTLDTKGYLFPTGWPLAVWLLNLAYAPIVVVLYRLRVRAGLAAPREAALVAGALVLLVPFAVAVPLVAARVALAVQMQTARIFWMLDFLAVVYVVWWVAEGARAPIRRAQIAAAAIVLASIVRGGYVMTVLFPERPVAQVDVRDDDWGRVMAWLRETPVGSGVIADPDHAARYGTSVRVAGERDVLVEAVKDTAIGMYSREIAMRTRERIAAVGDFRALSPTTAGRLGAQYGLGLLITEQSLALPIAFESGALRVYHLTPASPGAAKRLTPLESAIGTPR